MSNLAHHLDWQENGALAARVARALRRGGVFVIQEPARPERPDQGGQTGTLLGLYFALQEPPERPDLDRSRDGRMAKGCGIAAAKSDPTAHGPGMGPAGCSALRAAPAGAFSSSGRPRRSSPPLGTAPCRKSGIFQRNATRSHTSASLWVRPWAGVRSAPKAELGASRLRRVCPTAERSLLPGGGSCQQGFSGPSTPLPPQGSMQPAPGSPAAELLPSAPRERRAGPGRRRP